MTDFQCHRTVVVTGYHTVAGRRVPMMKRTDPVLWPEEITVPTAPMRGRAMPARLGDDEGQLCLRDHCLGTIEYLPDASLGGCGCAHSPMLPCSYCVSTMPECPRCGWRMD